MRALTIIIALLVAIPAWAAPGDVAGNWAVRSNGRVVMIVSVTKVKGGWRGHWLRPLHFSTDTDWQSLTAVAGPIVDRILVSAEAKDDGLNLTFAGATPTDRDTMILRRRDADVAWITWPGSNGRPLVLDRVKAGEVPIRPDPRATYAIDQHWRTNAEMTAIFDADQGDRQAPNIDWRVVGPRDKARLVRTRALLDSGALESGDDFYHAAFVFQHGGEPNDYLLAHSLAIVAVARGRADATWIAAATLDRYLQQIGRKQVFGTQFGFSGTIPLDQDPFDRTLLSDAMRAAMGVPPLAAQEERRRQLEAERAKRP